MDGILLRCLTIGRQLKSAAGSVHLMMEVTPFAHAQIGDVIALAVAAVLIARELLTLLFKVAPQI